MKQCISSLINWIKHLWQTLKEYVCRKDKSIKISIDSNHDGDNDIMISVGECSSPKEEKDEQK